MTSIDSGAAVGAAAPPGDNRPPAYLEDGTIILRASGINGCIRDLVLHLRGDNDPLPTPPELQARFDAGHEWEPKVLDRLMAMGWTHDVDMQQSENHLKTGPGVMVRFHPDAVMTPHTDPRPHIVEVKALAASSFEQAQRKGTGSLPWGYDFQASIMMYGLGLPLVWVALNKEDPDGELHIEFVSKPPVALGNIIKRAQEIKRAFQSGEVPDCDDLTRYPCPFLYLRPEREDTVELAAPSEQEEIDRYARGYDEWRAMEAEAKAGKAECRDMLMKLMGMRRGVRGSQFRVTRSMMRRTSFDRKAAEKEVGELSRFDKVSESEVIAVHSLTDVIADELAAHAKGE